MAFAQPCYRFAKAGQRRPGDTGADLSDAGILVGDASIDDR